MLSAFLLQRATAHLPWLRIPTVIAYILFGLFLGQTVSPIWKEQSGWLGGVSQFGLFYLMFLSGLEVDLRLLVPRRDGPKLLQKALLLFAATAVLSYALAWGMHVIDPQIQPWMMMLILSTTSLGIILPVLKERGLLRTVYGQTLLTAALLADLLTMLGISVAADWVKNGFSWRQLTVGLLIPLVAAFYVAILRLYRSKFWDSWFGGNGVLKMQGVLALLGLFGVMTDWTGSEPILGSFLVGLLVSSFRLPEKNPLRQQMESIGYSFVIPIFFVTVGAQFDLGAFFASETARTWVPLLLLCAYGVKLLPMLWFGGAMPLRERLAGGLLLSSRMTLVIVAASIGVQLHVIPREIEEAMLVVGIVTCICSPLLFSLMKKAHGPLRP
nr:cation:proton antiporter [Tumebacillus amylolyticus]